MKDNAEAFAPIGEVEIKEAFSGLALTATEDEMQDALVSVDNWLFADLEGGLQGGHSWIECLSAQIAVTRLYLAKAEHLKQQFESTRH